MGYEITSNGVTLTHETLQQLLFKLLPSTHCSTWYQCPRSPAPASLGETVVVRAVLIAAEVLIRGLRVTTNRQYCLFLWL